MKFSPPRVTELVAECDPRQLASDLFHQLSQPLTTLCCSLELALLQTPSAKEYGEIVSQALLQAEKASTLALAAQELVDAHRPGENLEVLDLRGAVEETVSDLLPVAEASEINLAYVPRSACAIFFDAQRLRQGLFHLLTSLIDEGGKGSVVKVGLEENGQEAVLSLTLSGAGASCGTSGTGPDRELLQRLGLGIARAIFEAAGSTFKVQRLARSLTVQARILISTR